MIYVVERKEGADWIAASSHTRQEDAEQQLLVFQNLGYLTENLRISPATPIT